MSQQPKVNTGYHAINHDEQTDDANDSNDHDHNHDQDNTINNSTESKPMGKWQKLFTQNKYSLYVLFLLLITYLLNQLDRYTLAVTSKAIEQSLHFGDGNGGGAEYQFLAGPAFTLIYTFAGIPIGYLADR